MFAVTSVRQLTECDFAEVRIKMLDSNDVPVQSSEVPSQSKSEMAVQNKSHLQEGAYVPSKNTGLMYLHRPVFWYVEKTAAKNK